MGNGLTPEQERKLARIQGRATLYETVMVNRKDGRKVVLCYTRKTKRGIIDYIHRLGRTGSAGELVAFCGAEVYRQPADGFVLAIGEWDMKFSGRTQREAIMGGELTFWKDGVQ